MWHGASYHQQLPWWANSKKAGWERLLTDVREKALSLRKAEKQTAGIQTLLQGPLWLPVPGPAWDSLTDWEAVSFTIVEKGLGLIPFKRWGWRVTKVLHGCLTGIL